MGFGRSGSGSIDLWSTPLRRNVYNSDATLLVHYKSRWYLKGFVQKDCGLDDEDCGYSGVPTRNEDGVTTVATHIDWIKSYRSPPIAAPLTQKARPSSIIIPLLLVGFVAAVLIIIGVTLMLRTRRSYPVSDLPLVVPRSDVVLTNKKTWRFSQLEPPPFQKT